ncbi:hypothetical protein KC960_04655, partial [Candidatus Saccharibacteria bacterium]|nr:hypothetical protein [Candidatus Saccharibacteria bacterium]
MKRLFSNRKTIPFVTLAVVLFAGFFSANIPKSSALSGSDFQAGRIIDNSVFFNTGAINVQQIQEFLNSKVPSCDTNGTQTIYDSSYGDTVTRAVYSSRRGVSTPFTCLKDYYQNIPGVTNSGSDLCGGSIGGGTKSAAQLIYEASVACGINPEVLIVLLQKEQSLVSDDWP